MGKRRPWHVELTSDEESLFKSFRAEAVADGPFSDEYGRNVAGFLRRLKARGAIPAVRLRYFTDADLNPGLRKSRQQVFIDNGCDTTEMILTSGNFFPYLEYFVTGPSLPLVTMSRFSELAIGPFRELETLRKFVRIQAKHLSHTALRDHVGDEFFKLAIECDLELVEARLIRTDAKNAMSRSRRGS